MDYTKDVSPVELVKKSQMYIHRLDNTQEVHRLYLAIISHPPDWWTDVYIFPIFVTCKNDTYTSALVSFLLISYCTAFKHFTVSEVNTEQVSAATSKGINPCQTTLPKAELQRMFEQNEALHSKYMARTCHKLPPEISLISQAKGAILEVPC